MNTFSAPNQTVAANESRAETKAGNPLSSPALPQEAATARPPRRFMLASVSIAGVLSLFWAAGWAAFLWGHLGRARLAVLPLPNVVELGAAMTLPPLLFIAVAVLIARGRALNESAEILMAASERLFAVDDVAANSAARLGRAVRRELDALNSGLDGAFQRLRALEQVLENQIAALDEAGARAEVHGETVAARLTGERERLESLSGQLTDAAHRAGETVAGRAAQLKSNIEAAEGALKMATQSLDVQAAGFRAAAQQASEAPHEAALELDAQVKRIEDVSDATLQRAEFVLARQEKQRALMNEMLETLKTESAALETGLARQQTGMENAVAAVRQEAGKFGTVTSDAERHLELLMANAAARANRLTDNFAREADKLKVASETANALLANLVNGLKDASRGANDLIGQSANQARQDAHLLVGEAMGECERLLRVAGELSAESNKIRTNLAKASEELERHLYRLPGLAQDEARRVRLLVQGETEQILDMSARTLSALHARERRPAAPAPQSSAGPLRDGAPGAEGLKGLARRLTQRKGKGKGRGDGAGAQAWEMKTLLAAVEGGDQRGLKPSKAMALASLENVLTEMALDLSALDGSEAGIEDYKRYLAGDRAVFVHRLAATIDEDAVDRITTLYRDDAQFHAAADAYLGEFETMLARAREGDADGILTSTLLSADTGKVYLAIAYALGRL